MVNLKKHVQIYKHDFLDNVQNFSRTMSNDRHSPVDPFFSPCVWVTFHVGGSGFTCALIHLLTVILSSMLVYFGCQLGAYMTFH